MSHARLRRIKYQKCEGGYGDTDRAVCGRDNIACQESYDSALESMNPSACQSFDQLGADAVEPVANKGRGNTEIRENSFFDMLRRTQPF